MENRYCKHVYINNTKTKKMGESCGMYIRKRGGDLCWKHSRQQAVRASRYADEDVKPEPEPEPEPPCAVITTPFIQLENTIIKKK